MRVVYGQAKRMMHAAIVNNMRDLRCLCWGLLLLLLLLFFASLALLPDI